MTFKRKTLPRPAPVGIRREDIELLHQINDKLGVIDAKVDAIRADAAKAGAVAGGVAGAMTGGLVATGIAIIKARFGF